MASPIKRQATMNRIKQFLLTILIVSLLTSCSLFGNVSTYKDKSEDFVETLLKEDYDKCMDLMAMEHEMAKEINVDTMKMGLAFVRNAFVENWGTDLSYSFIKTEKKFSTIEANNTPPNTTLVSVEFNNKKDVGIFQILFDDNSKKVLHIKFLDIKKPIPTMTYFWLFGFLAIYVPIFNIYIIWQIKRSDLKRKWSKYIAVIFLNVPAITYSAVNGLSFKLLQILIFLGVGFEVGNYLNSYWSFGIPLGGLYWFWKLKRKKDEITTLEISSDQDIEINNE